MRGKDSTLARAGGGFHQELTGRENIYLNNGLVAVIPAEDGWPV